MRFTADAKTTAELKRIVKALGCFCIQLEVNAVGSCVLFGDAQPQGTDACQFTCEFEVSDYEPGVIAVRAREFAKALGSAKTLTVVDNNANGFRIETLPGPLGGDTTAAWGLGGGACYFDRFALAEFAYWRSAAPKKKDSRASLHGVWFEVRPQDSTVYGYGTNGLIACYSQASAAYGEATQKKFRFLPAPIVSLMCRAGEVYMLDTEIPEGHKPKDEEKKLSKGVEVLPRDSYQVSFTLGGVDVRVYVYTQLGRIKLESVIPEYTNMSAELDFSEVTIEALKKAPHAGDKCSNLTVVMPGGYSMQGAHLTFDGGAADGWLFDTTVSIGVLATLPEFACAGMPAELCITAPALSVVLDGLLPEKYGRVSIKTNLEFPRMGCASPVVVEANHRSALVMPLKITCPSREAFYGLCKEVLFWLVDSNNPDMTEDELTDKEGVIKAINTMWNDSVDLLPGYPVDWADFVRRVLPVIRAEARKKIEA